MSTVPTVKLFDLLFERSVHLPTAHQLPSLEDAGYAVQTIVNLDNSKRGVPFAFEFPARSRSAKKYVIVAGTWGYLALPCLGEDRDRIVRPLMLSTNYQDVLDDPYDLNQPEDSPFPDLPRQIAGALLLNLPVVTLIEIIDSVSIKQLSGIEEDEKLYGELSEFLETTIHRLNGGSHLYLEAPQPGEYP